MAAKLTQTAEEGLPIFVSMKDERGISGTVERSQTAEAVEDMLFGSAAGGIGKVFEYPFDTVKVRLQSHGTSVYRNSLDCFQKSIRSDGVIRGLYRGVSAPIVGAAVETSSLFFSYRVAQNILLGSVYQKAKGKDDLTLDALLLAGAMSGAFTSLWLTPIELVKCQMQVPLAPGSIHGPGVLSVIRNVFRHTGPLGFWHGQVGTLIREAGGSAAWFGAYEGVKKFFTKQNVKTQTTRLSMSDTPLEPQLYIYQRLIAGACAGAVYNFAFFPADTVKSRMQTGDVGSANTKDISSKQVNRVATFPNPATGSNIFPKSAKQAPNFWSTCKTIWAEAGLKGMYRGCGITVARSAVSSPIIFGIYERLKGSRDS